MKTRLLTLLALSLAAPLTAQVTIPDGFLTTTGSGSTSYPFGRATPMRIQYLYDSTLVGRPVLAINELAFRGQENTTRAAKTGVEVEISMSTTSVDILNASTTFASNRGANELVVFTKKLVNLPAFASANPQPFAATFKLDKAFVYTRATGNLLIEYVMTQGVSGSYSHDTEFNGAATITAIGTSCNGPTQSVSGGRATSATSTLGFSLSNAPANAAAVHVLSFQKLPTPVPLPNGGCNLYIAPFAIFGFATSASGTASITYPTPVGTRTLGGPLVYGQWVVITPTSWPATQAHEVEIGGYLRHGRIYDLNGTTSATGTVQVGSGIIHRFQ